MKRNIFLLMALVTGVVVFGVIVLSGSAQGPFGDKPTPIPADAQTPAPTPEDSREVAILTLVINSTEEGKIEGVQLERGLIIQSFAPNVLGLPGEWTVELVGEEGTVPFGVLDPRHVEVENEQNAEQPYTYIYETSYVWELVVPLFDNEGKDLLVKEINIFDAEGNLIFNTPVDRERWSQ